MAFDPEARQSSNTAMILGVSALVLILGAIAYYATRPPAVDNSPTIIMNGRGPATNTIVTNTVVEEVPVPGATVVVTAPPVVVNNTVRTERNTSNTTVIQKPASGANATPAPRSSSGTNVTINNLPPSNNGNRAAAPVPPSSADGGASTSAAGSNADNAAVDYVTPASP